jgi:hypothetical protein
MSDNIESGPPNPLDSSLAKAGFAKEDAQPAGPVYQVVGDSKIAVSSQRGKLWKSRKGACQKGMKDLEDAWNEAIRYYNHDQSAHRDNTDPDHSGSRFIAKRINDRFSSTENIVYCNVNAQLPELYSKNPTIEVSAGSSSDDEAWEKSSDFARAVEKLVNVLFGLKTAPGVSLKNKAKRAVVVALLTNRVWFETGYVLKEGSSDNALNDLARLSQELVKAKDVEEIKEIEGALQALEEKIEFLQPSGPTLHIRMPHQVLVDPDHNDPWLSDANWLMIEDMMPTEYINAVFGKEMRRRKRRGPSTSRRTSSMVVVTMIQRVSRYLTPRKTTTPTGSTTVTPSTRRREHECGECGTRQRVDLSCTVTRIGVGQSGSGTTPTSWTVSFPCLHCGSMRTQSGSTAKVKSATTSTSKTRSTPSTMREIVL